MSLIGPFFRTLSGALLSFGLLVPGLCWADALDAQFLVTSEWLNMNRSNAQLRVLDLRNTAAYAAGHIDGAVNLPIEQLFLNDNGKTLIAPLAHIKKAFSQAGIDETILVVIYDAGEFLSAARVFWVFEVYGHARVVALDGGYAGWTQQQLPVSTTKVIPAPRNFVPTVKPNRLATKLTTRLAINQRNTVIIDARETADYRGEKSTAQRYGHIPSATNIPVKETFEVVNGVKHLKSVAQLQQSYREIDPSKHVITYCNNGLASAGTYFNLRRMGIDAANYDGSWTEWANDQALPIETPAPPPTSTGVGK